MFYAYVLQSVIDEQYYYKGHCSDIEIRLKEHNSGKTKSIKHKIPFKIVYYETFATRAEAIARERYFKSAAGRRYLKQKLL